MRVLVTGGAGLLGSTLLRLAPADLEIHATRRRSPVAGAPAHTVDLSDAAAVASLLDRLRPELVIHTAYGTADPERDILAATAAVTDGCAARGIRLVHLSTDALLDGERAPYPETADPDPVHEYGEWKARAEQHVRRRLPDAAVVRTSLIVDLEPLDPRSSWIERAVRTGDPITLFTDEIRSPIAVQDLAAQLWEIAALPRDRAAGRWHLAGPEALSRYAIGVLVAARQRLDPSRITPGLSRDAPGRRPRDLRLLTGRADRELRTRPRPFSSVIAGTE
jgi:dTDP-4-dehydrorhamnose reductase